MGIIFPWERGVVVTPWTPPAGSPAPTPATTDLEVRYNSVSVANDPAYLQIVPARKKRRWLVVQCPYNAALPVIILPAFRPFTDGLFAGRIFLDLGETVVFSETGDMPWKGGVWAAGSGGNSTVVWTEAVEYPWE